MFLSVSSLFAINYNAIQSVLFIAGANLIWFMAHSPLFVSERIDDDDETKVKRAKRDQSGVTGKNIVVLRSQDVVRRGGVFFMPNTIEMACIKKPGMGQFKTNVEFSSIMSEDDVKERLERTFPLLTGQR